MVKECVNLMEMGINPESKGKLVRCYFESPNQQTEFPFITRGDGTIVANLEGYAIIPMETWEKLTGKKFFTGE